MWSFSGIYSGDAKAYIREKQKREIVIYAIIILALALFESIFVAFVFI